MNKLNIFIADIKRSFTEPLFFLSLIIGGAMLLIPFLYLLIRGTDNAAGLFKTAQSMVFPFAAPLLCALPYSGMKMLENETKFSQLMLVKIRRSGYALPRFFSVGITGAAVLLVPQILLLAAALLCKAQSLDAVEICKGITLSIPFGFAFSSLAYALSFYNTKRYIPVLTPQVIYMLCVYAFPHLKLTRFYPPLGISPWIYGGADYADIAYVFAFLLILSIALTFARTAFRKEVTA